MTSDEYGVPVIVLPHSPARTHVLKLERRGFSWVVLQRKLLMGLTDLGHCDTIEGHVEQEPPRTLPNVEGTVEEKWRLLHIRLIDCESVLNA